LRRHHLLWIAPAHRIAVSGQIEDVTLAAVALRLLNAGAPLVVARQVRPAGGGLSESAFVTAGMPLPPWLGKHRLAFKIPLRAISRTGPPLRLVDAIPHLPATWRRPLAQLLRNASPTGIVFAVYGSAAWQALTGEKYLTPASDIDLLWRPVGPDQLASGIALLGDWEAATGLRADGEILFGDDDAVAWREWMGDGGKSSTSRVLVKSLAGARLCTRRELLARVCLDEMVDA